MKILSACLVAIVLATAVFKAQSDIPQKPTFRAGVNFVQVDVYVNRPDGKAALDLASDDFELQEDGVEQRIASFERIVARTPGPESERAEPASLEESNRAAADPHNRLFVIVFDTLHTTGYDAPRPVDMYDPRTVGRALASFLDRLIGADDLIAVMRPESPVDLLSFTRRPSSFMEFLVTGGEWQKRFVQTDVDETERNYQLCYPPGDPEVGDIAPAMIARRREMLMIVGLENLVRRLQSLREGRKAVLVVSEGWTLFTPDSRLARPIRGQVPGFQPIGVDRGKPTIGDPRSATGLFRADCERDRQMLSRLDDERDFRRMVDEANRANVTFYPVSPQGLTVASPFNRRTDSLVTLATATDGVAVTGSNDFAPGLNRIGEDLAGYYLLGYYSTNTKADGKFRKITVKVKQPGVNVRARRGYLAPTEAELATTVVKSPEELSRDEALAGLGIARSDRPLHIVAGYSRPQNASPAAPATLWVVGEIDMAAARQMPWSSGADASMIVTKESGEEVATAQVTLAALSPRFLLKLQDKPVGPGEYTVRVRARGKLGEGADITETTRVVVPPPSAAALAAPPLLYRRGPFTGAGFQPTADSRFRKAERLRVDVELQQAVESFTARLLDRKGAELPIPAVASLQDENGTKYGSAQITLAPLAQGDYIVELSAVTAGKAEKRLIAFRIVP